MKTMRIVLTLFTLFVVLVIGAVVAPNFINWDKYKPMAIEKINEATGLTAKLDGDIALGILPSPHVRLKGVTISAPSDTADMPLATLNALEVDVAFLPLLSKQVNVTAVTLDAPDINIVTDANGKANWMTPKIEALMAGKKTSDDNITKDDLNTGAADANAQENQAVDIAINDLEIKNGAVKLYDARTKKTTTVNAINMDIDADSLKGPFEIEGSLALNGQKIELESDVAALVDDTKNVAAELEIDVDGAQVEFKGDINTAAPFGLNGALQADVQSLSAALKPFGVTGIPAQFNAFKATGQLNATQDGGTYKDMRFSVNGETIAGDIVGTLNAQTKAIAVNTNLNTLPGGGALTANIDMLAQGIGFALKGDAKNIAKLMRFAGVQSNGDIPFTAVRFDVKGKQVGDAVQLNNSALTLDDMPPITLAGAYTKRSSGRDLIAAKISTPLLDLVGGKFAPKASDANGAAQSKAGAKKTLKDMAAKLALPFDLNFDAGVTALKTKQGTFKDISAKGGITGDTLKLTALNIGDLAGTSVSANGSIGALKSLSGITLNTDVKSSNILTTMAAFGMKTDGIPPAVKGVNIDAAAKGSADNLNVNAAIKAAGGTFTAVTKVGAPLSGSPKIGTLNMRLQHPNAANMINAFAPAAPTYVSLGRPADVKMNITMGDKKIGIADISGTLAGATLNGDVNIATGGAVPSVNGALNIGDLTLKSGGGSSSSGGGKSGGAKWSSAKMDNSWLSAANIDLDIRANALTYETWNLSQPKMSFKLGGGKLDIRNLSAGLYGGSASINGALSALGGGGMSMSLAPTLKGIQLEPLVKSAAGNKILSGSGAINFDGKFSGAGASQKAIVSSLSGDGTATGSNIVINGLDIAKFVNAFSGSIKVGTTAMSLLDSTGKSGSTSFDSLDGAFTMNNGVATLSKLNLNGAQAGMTSNGTVDLPKWWINTKHKLTVNNAAQAEDEDVPSFTLNINGPINNPTRGLAEGAINNYLQKRLTKKLEKVLGGSVNEKVNEKLNKVLGDKLGDKLGGTLGNTLGGGNLGGNLGDALGGAIGGSAGSLLKGVLGTPTPDPQTTPAPVVKETPKAAPSNDNAAPAAAPEPEPVTAPAPATEQLTPEDVVNDAVNSLIKGLF